jgi:hypothetical protein
MYRKKMGLTDPSLSFSLHPQNYGASPFLLLLLPNSIACKKSKAFRQIWSWRTQVSSIGYVVLTLLFIYLVVLEF